MLWKEIRGANNFLPYYHPSIILLSLCCFSFIYFLLSGVLKVCKLIPSIKKKCCQSAIKIIIKIPYLNFFSGNRNSIKTPIILAFESENGIYG